MQSAFSSVLDKFLRVPKMCPNYPISLISMLKITELLRYYTVLYKSFEEPSHTVNEYDTATYLIWKYY